VATRTVPRLADQQRNPGALSRSRGWLWWPCKLDCLCQGTEVAPRHRLIRPPQTQSRRMNDSWPVKDGRTPGWCSRPISAPPSTRRTSGRCSSGCADGGGRRQLDATRATHFIRKPDEPSRRQHRGDRPAGRARLHPDNRIEYRCELRLVITTGAGIRMNLCRRLILRTSP
jgi:hypothetical protein